MKKVLFIDRDGTILKEPDDEQVDALEKLGFLPDVIPSLKRVKDVTDYEWAMVTNQDGLGTDSFPEDTFWPSQNMMIDVLKSQGVTFDEVFIDEHFENDNHPNRKPGIGMLVKYQGSEYDILGSYVIGDRVTDVILAKNLGAKAIFINDGSLKNEIEVQGLTAQCALISDNWNEIADFLILQDRKVKVERNTKETQISIELNLDGTGKSEIKTGLNFFDHMLDQIAKHSQSDLIINVTGDLHIDEHHTIEDTAIALGDAYLKAFGNKMGTARYGYLLPMDDCLAQVAIDFGGRPWIEWDVEFKREKVGDMPTEMVYHFFKSFSDNAQCNLNVKAEGDNEHHKIESLFKGLAKAILMAKKRDANNFVLPSTKGKL